MSSWNDLFEIKHGACVEKEFFQHDMREVG
jgi:hypothetical protein